MELPRAFFEVSTGSELVGRVVFELRPDVAPRTCANFLALCAGDKGEGVSGKRLSYQGTPFHRVIPRFMIQGGDFECGDGTGGESIYGRTFEDESFQLRHDSAGVLSMANAGPDTNGSQFFITLDPAPYLDGKHVVFGRVVEGLGVCKKIESWGSKSGKPQKLAVISRCGVLQDEQSAIAAKLKAEMEEERKYRSDPIGLDVDSEALKRLGAVGGEGGQEQPTANRATRETQGRSRDAPGAVRASDTPAEGDQADRMASPSKSDDDAEIDLADPAALEKLNPRQRRLFSIKQRMGEARAMNHKAAVTEVQRESKPKHDPHESDEAKYRWYLEKKKRHAKELQDSGLGEAQAHRLVTAENAEKLYQKKQKTGALSGAEIFTTKAGYKAHERRTANAPVALEEYEAAKARGENVLRAGDALVQHEEVPAENVDRMVAELENQQARREQFRRRRAHRESRDVDAISDRNKTFNRKLQRVFGQYVEETKNNLERGTALPDGA
ncbi:unnamed protein product [Pedinophyceae sp. YPF-701]|nr:unnamed protein product [Pedinophyceae sp. YPF-701]